MFIKKPILMILAVVVIVAMIVEWQVAAGWGRAMSAHYYHGLCNSGVGWPYSEFIHELRTRSDAGETNAVNRALRRADDRSRDMFDVWLTEKPDAYRSSIGGAFR